MDHLPEAAVRTALRRRAGRRDAPSSVAARGHGGRGLHSRRTPAEVGVGPGEAIEGTVRLYTEYLRQTFGSTILARLSFILARNAFNKMRARIDPRRYNGATFLGLNGIVVKSHGGTDSFGFANAVSVAVDMVSNNINDFIMHELSEYVEQHPTEVIVSG